MKLRNKIVIVFIVFIFVTYHNDISTSSASADVKVSTNNTFVNSFFKTDVQKEIEEIKTEVKTETKIVNNQDLRYTDRSNVARLSEKQKIIYRTCRSIGMTDNAQIASVLGQIRIEVDNFELREEADYLGAGASVYRARYAGYHGRGLIQLTWKSNYQNWTKWLNVDLVNNPNILMSDYELNAKIACSGIYNGSFTGSGKLDSYINDSKIDYYNSRSIVNGDKHYIRNNQKIGNILVNYSQEFYNLITK